MNIWKLRMRVEIFFICFFGVAIGDSSVFYTEVPYNYGMLRQKLQDDQLTALKSGDKARLTVLRFVISQVKNKEIEKKTELNDEETLVVLKKFAKELKESIDAFTKGNRTELADESRKQLEIISAYLPKEISDEELGIEMDKILEENKALVEGNPKAVIGIVMGRLKSKADPSRIMPMLRSKISL